MSRIRQFALGGCALALLVSISQPCHAGSGAGRRVEVCEASDVGTLILAQRGVFRQAEPFRPPPITTLPPRIDTPSPLGTYHPPVVTSPPAIDTSRAPVDTPSAPIDTSRVPVDTPTAPIDASPAPADTSDNAADTSDGAVDQRTVEFNGLAYEVSENFDLWQDAVRSQKPPIAFIVQRIAPRSDGRAVYVLITGDGTLKSYAGNGKLRDLAADAVETWTNQDGTPPPRLTMVGDGTQQDFDAALLTMRMSDLDDQGGDGESLTAIDSLTPPPEFADLPGFETGSYALTARQAAVVLDNDQYTGTFTFRAGVVRIAGRTREVVAVVLAAVRAAVADFVRVAGVHHAADLEASARAALVTQVQAQAAAALQAFLVAEPDVRSPEDNGIEVTVTLAGQITSWTVTQIGKPGQNTNEYASLAR